ncbi:PepSY domain-containing protein [Hyphomicrobium sp.]|uniref:PepSY domain-containing protein n=1 Tax=Hyphomicrobium sp. TaxID=82 RepID=UPI002E2F2CBD|nr:PepSY domain-containing protein [Hyphomicrobium sp.]HEX2841009.1 PepSY domain-containing protein [Hyphomicrobium sp.]
MRWLYLTHRWLGIVTCILCAIWFLSGLVMVYVPYPSWRDDERVSALPPLAASQILISPGEALAKAELKRAPTSFRLEMAGDEPVYRIVDGEWHVAVSARDGSRIESVTQDAAERMLRGAFPDSFTYLGPVEADQWTVTRRFAPYRPLHHFEADDGLASRYYVSSRTGEIVQSTTRSERMWNWFGSVPHWIYFTALRADPSLWRDVIIWTSGLATVGAIFGLWIGVARIRLRRRYGGTRMSPYRGIMKWHHVSGLIGGVFVITWLFSGWLSVGPFDLFRGIPVTPDQLARYYVPDTLTFNTSAHVLAARIGPNTKEIQFSWVGGAALFVANDGRAKTAYDARDGAPFVLTQEAIVQAAETAMSEVPIAAVKRLDEYDLYWYAHRSERVLPALRLIFNDPPRTWLTVDLKSGRIVDASDASVRWERWLFNFLHLYDHPGLLARPLLRESLIWVLSIAGFIVSITGVIVGVRYLQRA